MRAVLACGLVAIAVSPAWAFRLPDPNAPIPTQHQLELRYSDHQQQPYAQNYADEAARNLGIQDGKWEAFSTHPNDPLAPRFKGGIEGGKAMIGLQWRFGS